VPDRADLTEIIAQLASSDRAAREAAARELYRFGCALGDSIAARWRASPDFAALLAGPPTVGVAVQPDRFEKIRAANGSPRLADVPPDQDAKEFELHWSGGTSLDILTTTAPGEKGAIARFLEKFGEGIQQVEYGVKNVERATEILRTRFSQQPVYPQTRAGANDTCVNFFLAIAPDGRKVLIELVGVSNTEKGP
jgi:hypothetical protein